MTLIAPTALQRGVALLTLGLTVTGCVTDLGTLSGLESAYGDQTVAVMTPALQGSMAIGAFAADACVQLGGGAWKSLAAGVPLPLSEPVSDVLAAPVVDAYTEGNTIELGLSPVRLAGLEDARVVLTIVTGSPLQLTGSVTDAGGQTVLADLDLEVTGECTRDWGRVSGAVVWTLDDIEQTVTLPSDASGLPGVDWPGTLAWLPAAGIVGWQGRIDGELRSFESDEAALIEGNGSGGLWSGGLSGLQWSTTVTVDLQP